MKVPIYVRALSPVEQAGIEAGLRSSNAFTLRRSQILLASSRERRSKKNPYLRKHRRDEEGGDLWQMLFFESPWGDSKKNL